MHLFVYILAAEMSESNMCSVFRDIDDVDWALIGQKLCPTQVLMSDALPKACPEAMAYQYERESVDHMEEVGCCCRKHVRFQSRAGTQTAGRSWCVIYIYM